MLVFRIWFLIFCKNLRVNAVNLFEFVFKMEKLLKVFICLCLRKRFRFIVILIDSLLLLNILPFIMCLRLILVVLCFWRLILTFCNCLKFFWVLEVNLRWVFLIYERTLITRKKILSLKWFLLIPFVELLLFLVLRI